MSLLFRNLTRSSSLKALDMSFNDFGMNGIQSMVPLLGHSNITKLNISENDNINTEGFRLLMGALNGGSMKELLFLHNCRINDITSLENCTLPHLEFLDLGNNCIQSIPSLETCKNLQRLSLASNNIENEGCISIAKLIQKERPPVRRLDLDSNRIGDDGAEILCSSLKFNSTLNVLHFRATLLDERGCIAFLKILCDVSSINNTCNSNHTLRDLFLPVSILAKINKIQSHVLSATQINYGAAEINAEGDIHHSAGRAKVIAFQLDSRKRMEICQQQGVDYTYSSLFANIESFLLPEVLALVAEKHGQNELFQMLIATAPSLPSLINKKAMMKDTVAKNTARIKALAAECSTLIAQNYDIKKRLISMESDGKNQPLDIEERNNMDIRGKKRRRSASF
ncbi:hypothetical protein ACHAXR_007737 [Thalassiosira sp. AJA248-18]